MKISINIDDSFQTDEIVINSKCLTPELERIISTIRLIDQQMTVTKDGELFFIDVMMIIYVESVDRKTFVYTDNNCYETKLKLYEMEEQLKQNFWGR